MVARQQREEQQEMFTEIKNGLKKKSEIFKKCQKLLEASSEGEENECLESIENSISTMEKRRTN